MTDGTWEKLKQDGLVLLLVTLFASLAGLALVVILAGVGAVIAWNSDSEEAEEVATVDETETTNEEIADNEEEPAEVASSESWSESAARWWDEWRPGGESEDATPEESATDDATASSGTTSTEPETATDDATATTDDNTSDAGTATTSTEPSTSTPSPVVVKGVKPYGVATWVPGKSGPNKATFTVVLGDVPNSARSQAGETETYWLQGLHTDPNDGSLRADVGDKVLDPDAIRGKVGTKKAWTPIPGFTGVYGKCMAIQAADGEHPGGCTYVADPPQVASR